MENNVANDIIKIYTKCYGSTEAGKVLQELYNDMFVHIAHAHESDLAFTCKDHQSTREKDAYLSTHLAHHVWRGHIKLPSVKTRHTGLNLAANRVL